MMKCQIAAEEATVIIPCVCAKLCKYSEIQTP